MIELEAFDYHPIHVGNLLVSLAEMSEEETLCPHCKANSNGLGGGAVVLGHGVAMKSIVKRCFVHENGASLANFNETFGWPTIATVGNFEAGGKGEGYSFGPVAVLDVCRCQIGQASGSLQYPPSIIY